ncbi:porin family protein [Simiduia sp. 21SJ11W-1]|uniref:porin family protein n=1 Tax=Simiduia sp. 21SJ11W-1 TaxID=2909669 RepID=UPI0020A13DF2|nr:porin family protein [Simiduia sp. 21SJ11W-1]UTA46503.1 porin family protein [Simiduia sp. 21SJ11W-1]
MKHISLFALLLTFSLNVLAQAEREGVYGGIGLGVMSINYGNADNPTNASLQLGYHFNDHWAAELQYTDSLSDGKVTVQSGYYSSSVDVSIQTMAAYAVYRSPGQVYFKGRAGVLQEKVLGASDSGLSVGLGLGFKIADSAAIELDATLIEQDVNYFSASLNFGF